MKIQKLNCALALLYLLVVGSYISQAQNITKPNIHGPAMWDVNSYTGNVFFENSYLFLPGKGISIDIKLAYNSGATNVNEGFGNGWTFKYNQSYETSGQDILVKRSDGQKDLFTFNGTGYTTSTWKI